MSLHRWFIAALVAVEAVWLGAVAYFILQVVA